MPIAHNCVVTIHYTLKDDAGEVVDSSRGGEPIAYLHGHGNLVPGLEREMEGKIAGDKVIATIAPADGYGDYEKGLVQQVPRRSLQGVKNLKVGQRLQADTPQGRQSFVISRLVGDMVTLDGNHPLAGKNLNFDVEIVDIREATEEELAHGHVHGDGGHHH